MVLKFTNIRSFIKAYLKIKLIHNPLHDRELSVAVEFVYYFSKYSHTPLVLEAENEEGKMVNIAEEWSVMEQTKHAYTLGRMKNNLKMSHTVFRKYVAQLKAREFFKGGTINDEFLIKSKTIDVQLRL